MEYLVTMTTHVPEGTAEHDVADMRAREAANTVRLAQQGKVQRLWRPPLQPGEWRTIGLFTADDAADLERTLATMPLRVWRSDEVTPLGPHPNDPGYQRTALDASSTEFLTTFVLTVPPATAGADVEQMEAGERARTHELAEQGRLIRLWTLAGTGRALGHWQATDDDAMASILQSLPMAGWLRVDTVALSRHPSDPAS